MDKTIDQIMSLMSRVVTHRLAHDPEEMKRAAVKMLPLVADLAAGETPPEWWGDGGAKRLGRLLATAISDSRVQSHTMDLLGGLIIESQRIIDEANRCSSYDWEQADFASAAKKETAA